MRVWTRVRVLLLIFTLLVGAASGIAVGLSGGVPHDGMFGSISSIVHGLMSVLVPFLGVLWISDVRRNPGVSLRSGYLSAMTVALGVGVFGVLAAAGGTALRSEYWVSYTGVPEPWRQDGTVAVGGVIVQLVAQSVGTGFGLLIRNRAVAMVATIAVPLGLYLILGLSPAISPARDWLTPFAAVQHVFSTQMSALNWVQWLVIMLIWVVGLNLAGLARLSGKPLSPQGSPLTR